METFGPQNDCRNYHNTTTCWLLLAAAFINFQAFAAQAAEPPPLQVSTAFPNGSGEVESIDQQTRTVRIKPAPHPGHGWDCWWYFHITGIEPGETITVELSGNSFALANQATFSTDGHTWHHTAPGEKQPGRTIYRQQINANEAWFAWGPPFTNNDAATLIANAAKTCPAVTPFELCHSRANRLVLGLHINEVANETKKPRSETTKQPSETNTPATDQNHRFGIWVIARQHAWESGGSWVCRGLVDWLVSDDPRAVALRRKADFHIVPLIDVDNVDLGAGGKEEQPQDHNRDWTDHPFHPAVAAAEQEILKANAAGQFDLFVDLHNPSPTDKRPVFYISPRTILTGEGWANLQTFLADAQVEMTGPLAYHGDTRESGPGYDARWQQIGKNWVTQHTAGHVVSVTLETAWNTPDSTSDNYLMLGRQLGLAMERYFRDAPKKALAE